MVTDYSELLRSSFDAKLFVAEYQNYESLEFSAKRLKTKHDSALTAWRKFYQDLRHNGSTFAVLKQIKTDLPYTCFPKEQEYDAHLSTLVVSLKLKYLGFNDLGV